MEEIITFSTYESQIYGFSCDYPSNWIKTDNSFFVVGFKEKEELTYPSFNIQIIDLSMFSRDTSLVKVDQFQQMIMGEILRVGAKPSSFSDELIGGKYNGRSIIYYLPNDHMKSKQSFFFDQGHAYIISYTSKADEFFQQHLYVHDHAISSFNLFKCKGYKFLQLSMNSLLLSSSSSSSTSNSNEIYLEYFYPKDWSKKINGDIQHIYKDEKVVLDGGLVFSITKSDSEFTNDGSLGDECKDIQINLNYRDGNGKKLVVVAKQYDSDNGRDVLFQFDQWIRLSFRVPNGDKAYYVKVFDRLINYLGVTSGHILKARSPLPYDIFDNLMVGYNLNIPKSFELASIKPNGEMISFKDTTKNTNDLPYCVRIAVEDISSAGIIRLNEYSNDVIGRMLQLLPESKLLTEEPSFIRLDKHLASTASIQCYDVELGQPSIQLIATSVQKSHGIVITMRTKASNQFGIIYKKSFYIFDSFCYYYE
ncbi:hypothetical protein DDB_G0293108 [Dictyostelium discoideum AX4]|uniref:Uncharacterized protein n=1 Tax=Dictyostelium discoideum TaxID=44689 RepID=Q54C86_DICDI|nr:hypothetical protein DDB_G0293108 [Dictyostelium discoideum AX4]EAL60906.1 hypothetical protein DDB_G0293108 [Dictyostelium discoideum AX4]|eukprot:XP_629333.1 hypothetical protein DDB_G0293108 [Dictyostelium discoideum AX4]